MLYYEVTDQIQLRLMEKHNATELYELIDFNREYLREFLQWVDGTQSVKDIEAYIKSNALRLAERDGIALGIYYSNKLVGMVDLINIDDNILSTEVGYWLSKDYLGRGIMTKCVEVMIDYSFNTLMLNRFILKAIDTNDRSNNIAKRLGMTKEGVLRKAAKQNGEFHDVVIYSLLKDEYKK